jgi:cytosine/adenosine deaminase-related metal-dependent hydrolase
MIVYRAAWVCPIEQPPIAQGWVATDNGRIVGVGGPADPLPDTRDRPLQKTGGDKPLQETGRNRAQPLVRRDLGRVALMPGLVNAHTHLEMSWLRGRVPPSASFVGWITQLFALRRRPEDPADPEVLSAARRAAREARDSGTVAVGDISNSLASVAPMAEAGLQGVIFHELLGFSERDGSSIDRSASLRRQAASRGARVSIAPHATYSTSPELFRAIRAAVNASDLPITSVHLGESPEEVEMLVQGTGAWPAMLRVVGVWRDDWNVPRCGPVEYLDGLGILDERTLVVHGVQFDDAALARVTSIGATLVTCPRSNRWVGVGVPPIERFYRSGVSLAVGTDSLASVGDLNLFSELKTMRWLAPSVPARELLKSATLVGARALGLDSDLGTLAPGKLDRMIAVELPEGVDDVEAHLVNGIEPSEIRPLGTSGTLGTLGTFGTLNP